MMRKSTSLSGWVLGYVKGLGIPSGTTQKLKTNQTSMVAFPIQPMTSLPSANQEQSQLQTFKDDH